METFGERLRRLRTDKGLSLDELAAKTGVTKAYLWRLETSPGVNPSLDIVNRLAAGLSVAPGSLISDQDSSNLEPVDVPPALKEAQARFGIAQGDIADLARIRFRGGQPMTADDWIGLYLQLKRSATTGG